MGWLRTQNLLTLNRSALAGVQTIQEPSATEGRRRRGRGTAAVRLLVACIGWGLLGAWGSPAGAASLSAYGGSGLLSIPTADTLPAGTLALGYHAMDDQGVAALAAGVVGGVEAGVASSAGQRGSSGLRALAKVQLQAESSRHPAIAVGMEGASLYLVLSRQLAQSGLRGHIGVGNGRFGGVFAGINGLVNPVSVRPAGGTLPPPAVAWMLEHDGRALHAGARLHFGDRWTLDAGWTGTGWHLGVSLAAQF